MRYLLLTGTVMALAACAAQPQTPTTVSWQYGAGNGDGVAYQGPTPVYTRAFGPGNGDTVTSGQTATEQYSWGADGQSGTMVQTTPTPPTRTASPAQPATPAPARTHS